MLDIKELLVSKEVSVTSNLGAGIVPFNWQSFELHHLHLQDEEITKGMAYLFAEMGESYVDLIATGMSSLDVYWVYDAVWEAIVSYFIYCMFFT